MDAVSYNSRLLFGFMLTTWLLSMLISNTSTAVIMLSILEAVLQKLQEKNTVQEHTLSSGGEALEHGIALHKVIETDSDQSVAAANYSDKNTDSKPETTFVQHLRKHESPSNYDSRVPAPIETCVPSPDADVGDKLNEVVASHEEANAMILKPTAETEDEDFKNFCKGMTLAIPISANVGGLATITGTPTNVAMKGIVDDLWQMNTGSSESPITFPSWMVIGLPVASIWFVIVWICLTILFIGWRALACRNKRNFEREREARIFLKKEYRALGKISFAEVTSGSMFIILIFLWFFRSPGFITGWADLWLFKEGYIHEAVPSIFIGVSLFVIPRNLPTTEGKTESLLTWQAVHKKFPWSVVFLVGGGFSLAQCCKVSGLSHWVSEQISVLGKLDLWLCIFIICFTAAMLTEVTSNTATCTILLPIAAALAEDLGYNPLLLMIPTAISTSLSFMLPVATPANAIALSYGRLRVLDMVKAGAILKLLCILPIHLAISTWGFTYFQLDRIPWNTSVSDDTSAVFSNTTVY